MASRLWPSVMEGQTTCFVSGTLAAVLRVSKCLGGAPLKFVKQGKGWRVSLSRSCSLIGYILITLISLCSVWIITCALQHGRAGGRCVQTAIILMSTLLCNIVVFGASRRMRCFITCLNQIKKTRSELSLQKWPALWSRKQNAFFIFWAGLSVTVNLFDFTLLTLAPRNNLREIAAWLDAMPLLACILDVIVSVGTAQFLLIALHVKTCFLAVNNCIERALREIENNEVFEEKSTYKAKHQFKRFNNSISLLNARIIVVDTAKLQSPYTAIRRATAAYVRACDMVYAVNHQHGPMLLLMLALSLLQLIFKFYNIVVSIIQEQFFASLTVFTFFEVAQIAWCIYYWLNLVMIIEPCNMTHDETDRTRELMSRLMRLSRSTYDPLTAEVELFFRQVTLNQVAYMPLHVTTITRSLILTVISSIVTYVVILVNMK